MEYSDPRDFGFRPETVMTALMPYEQFSSKTRRLILGIDMGIASVGVCLIDIRNHEIILMASHIFKAPVEGKQKDISARQSGASIRRGYRSVRRTTNFRPEQAYCQTKSWRKDKLRDSHFARGENWSCDRRGKTLRA